MSGLAYLNGKIYGDDLFRARLYVFDANSLNLRKHDQSSSWVGYLSGLAGDPDRDVLWGVAQGSPGTLYEIDPATGSVLNSGPLNNAGYEQDLAYANGQLIVSDSARASGLATTTSTITIPSTLTLHPAPAGRYPGLRLRSRRRRSRRRQHRLVPVQCERRRQPGADHHHARRRRAPTACSSSTTWRRRSTCTTRPVTWSPRRRATRPTAATTSSTGRP